MVRKKRCEGAEEVVEPVKAEEREKSSPTRPRRRERSANGRFVPSTNKDVEPREKALSLDELSAVGELRSELNDEDGVDMLANWMHWTAVAPSRAAWTVSEAAAGCLRCGSPTRSLDDDFCSRCMAATLASRAKTWAPETREFRASSRDARPAFRLDQPVRRFEPAVRVEPPPSLPAENLVVMEEPAPPPEPSPTIPQNHKVAVSVPDLQWLAWWLLLLSALVGVSVSAALA